MPDSAQSAILAILEKSEENKSNRYKDTVKAQFCFYICNFVLLYSELFSPKEMNRRVNSAVLFFKEEKLMYKHLIDQLQTPVLNQQSDFPFWNDQHISKQMLKAHLDPNFEGVSRNFQFIEDSVQWIAQQIPPNNYPNLLDIGCGPGLYAEKFCKAGFAVTGLDFSKCSIAYAKQSAEQRGLKISYEYQDYLKMNYDERFDFATFIYCDYGALSQKNRIILLKKIYNSLKKRGKLLLDVFSMQTYENFKEAKTWEVNSNGGFWCEEEYIALNNDSKFSENITLRQTTVVTAKQVRNYYLLR